MDPKILFILTRVMCMEKWEKKIGSTVVLGLVPLFESVTGSRVWLAIYPPLTRGDWFAIFCLLVQSNPYIKAPYP